MPEIPIIKKHPHNTDPAMHRLSLIVRSFFDRALRGLRPRGIEAVHVEIVRDVARRTKTIRGVVNLQVGFRFDIDDMFFARPEAEQHQLLQGVLEHSLAQLRAEVTRKLGGDDEYVPQPDPGPDFLGRPLRDVAQDLHKRALEDIMREHDLYRPGPMQAKVLGEFPAEVDEVPDEDPIPPMPFEKETPRARD